MAHLESKKTKKGEHHDWNRPVLLCSNGFSSNNGCSGPLLLHVMETCKQIAAHRLRLDGLWCVYSQQFPINLNKRKNVMKKSFEDRRRKPIKPSRVITMAEFVNATIVRVILARPQPKVFAR